MQIPTTRILSTTLGMLCALLRPAAAQTADELAKQRPVNFQLAAGPDIASPDGGPDWRFRLVTTFLFPR